MSNYENYYEDIFKAAQAGNVEGLRYFIEEKNVDPSVKAVDGRGGTPLHFAAYYANIKAVEYLISCGADIHARTISGFTPLHDAAFTKVMPNERVEIAKILVSKGADINAKTNKQNTPIDLARTEKCDEMINYLNSIGAKSGSTSSGGCYIATAVYGSYDCPQVCTLRRFRDNELSTIFMGRIFIKLYYFFSPQFVKLLGKVDSLAKFCRNRLDKFVYKLELKGYKNTPYND